MSARPAFPYGYTVLRTRMLLQRPIDHHRLSFAWLSSSRSGGGIGRLALGPGTTLVELAENHFAGGGLQNRGDGNVDRFADHLSGIVDHHHGSVVQIGDALVVFLAFLED